PFLSAPGEARADWWQLAEVGRRMGFGSEFDYGSPAAIYAEHAALSTFENEGERDFDIGAHAGIDPKAYEDLAPFQWPLKRDGSSLARFFADGGFFTADRRARLVPVTTPAVETVDHRHPFTLNTGRIRDHWHTMTRTGKSARLSAHIAEPFCEIHPADAANAGIGDADLVRIEGANGRQIIVRALLSERLMRGALFVPMHWTGETAPSARVDTLVSSRVDPISGQPALKMARVSVARHTAQAHGFLVTRTHPRDLPFAYWAIAKTEGGYRLEFAGDPPSEGWDSWLRRSLLLEDHHEFSGYLDRQAGDHRLLAFEGDTLLAALFVSPEPVSVSRQWAVDQLEQRHSDRHARSTLIAGRPAAGRPDKGTIVCSCFSVGINEINSAAQSGCRSVDEVGVALSAGTNCGSCRPEIRRILDATQALAAE
nr:molybdopterin dinucleotide binding domain-containing protein [Rhizobium sp.]